VLIKVRLFAQMRLTAGRSEVELDVPEGTTVDQALLRFYEKHPDLSAHAPYCMVAVGVDYADAGRILREGDEVSLIPPVQGG
jgi:sulfur-carrier protein